MTRIMYAGVKFMAEQTMLYTRIAVSRDTTANWNKYPMFRPKRGEVIVYEDHDSITDERGEKHLIPGIKIGDGNAYLIDLPFCDDGLRLELLTKLHDHAARTDIHVTQEDKIFWNHKLNYEIEGNVLRFVITGNKEEE